MTSAILDQSRSPTNTTHKRQPSTGRGAARHRWRYSTSRISTAALYDKFSPNTTNTHTHTAVKNAGATPDLSHTGLTSSAWLSRWILKTSSSAARERTTRLAPRTSFCRSTQHKPMSVQFRTTATPESAKGQGEQTGTSQARSPSKTADVCVCPVTTTAAVEACGSGPFLAGESDTVT